MSMLTREVVKDFIPLALKQESSVDTDGGYHTVYDALAKMIDHDAEQRQTIEAQAQRIVQLANDVDKAEHQRNVALAKLEDARVRIREFEAMLERLHRDSTASDFNEHWDSYVTASQLLASRKAALERHQEEP